LAYAAVSTTPDDAARMRAICDAALKGNLSSADRSWARSCGRVADEGGRILSIPTPTPSSSPTPTPTPSSTPTPSCTGQANPACTGVPSGWVPKTTKNTNWRITTPGVYEDVRVNGSIQIVALNVTLRRIEVVGGIIDNEENSVCYNGLVLEDVSVIQSNPRTNDGANGVIGPGGYTARRVKIMDRQEGFRSGGSSDAGCGPVVIQDSFAWATPPQPCGEWHGDAIQGYDSPPLTVNNVTLWLDEQNGCGGTAPFFDWSGAGNAPVDITNLLVRGGGFSFRLAVGGVVRNLMIVDGSWFYGAVDVPSCNSVEWVSANIVTIDSAWQPTVVRPQACG